MRRRCISLFSVTAEASFWGGVAQLLGLAILWAVFRAERKAARARAHETLKAVALGLEEELKLISPWASGAPSNPGYKQASPEAYQEEKAVEWSDPTRIIFPLQSPAIHGLTSSTQLGKLQGVIAEFVQLNFSLTRLFAYYADYRSYVFDRPGLTDAALEKAASGEALTREEALFRAGVYYYNYCIHVEYIGGDDSTDPNCLYKSFRRAKRSLEGLVDDLKEDAAPRWYWIGDGIAGLCLLYGLFLASCWWWAVAQSAAR